jgi:hypothetical protein
MSFGWLLKAVSKERRVLRPRAVSPSTESARLRANSGPHSAASNEQSHEWHHPVGMKPLSDAPAESDLVIRRTQSQGAVHSLQTNSTASRMRQQGVQEDASHNGADGEEADSSKSRGLAQPEHDGSRVDSTDANPAMTTRREKPPPISVITNRSDPHKDKPL